MSIFVERESKLVFYAQSAGTVILGRERERERQTDRETERERDLLKVRPRVGVVEGKPLVFVQKRHHDFHLCFGHCG